jgi:outer membrane immunogenic protein
MTKRALAGGFALAAGTALCVCSAQAADLPMAPRPAPMAPVAYVAPVYNWSGFYIGGHAGGGFANSSWSDPITGVSNDTFSKSGFLGGAQIGANAQFNWLVVGLEGDFSWTGLKGSGTNSLGDTINTNVNWTSTVTGRVGAAFDRLLVYGKGGLALANDQSSFTDLGGITSNNGSITRTGWTVGGGLEYGFDKNWSAKVEYDYLGFGSQTMNFTTPLAGPVSSNASLNVQEVKAGLNFRFGQ